MTKTFPRGFIERTNEEYAAWCKTFYNPSALDHRGMPGLHGLWAWQEQERRKVKEWQPIETAPKDNKRPLYLARIDAQGKILELAHDAIWEYWQESWEMPHINGYAWESVGGIEEPTHWAYQDEGPPPPETAGAPNTSEASTYSSREIMEAITESTRIASLVKESSQPIADTKPIMEEIKAMRLQEAFNAAHSNVAALWEEHARAMPAIAPPIAPPSREDWRDWRGTILPTFKDEHAGWRRSAPYLTYQLRVWGHVEISAHEVDGWTDDQCKEAEAWARAVHLYGEEPMRHALRPPRPPIHLLAQPLMRSVHWDDQEG